MECTIIFSSLKTNHQMYTRYEVEGSPMINELTLSRFYFELEEVCTRIPESQCIPQSTSALDNSHHFHQFALYSSITRIIFINYSHYIRRLLQTLKLEIDFKTKKMMNQKLKV